MNTFLSKVDAEREVLRVVNQIMRTGNQLAGLSARSIAAWQSRSGIAYDDPCIRLLLDLADDCQTLSNRSNENFLPLPEKKTQEINGRIAALRRTLSRVTKESDNEGVQTSSNYDRELWPNKT